MTKAPLYFALVAAGAAAVFFTNSPKFSDQDIANVERSVKAEFEGRGGLSVTSVHLIRESATKLTGYVKIHSDDLGIDVQKACTATYGTDGKEIAWRCD